LLLIQSLMLNPEVSLYCDINKSSDIKGDDMFLKGMILAKRRRTFILTVSLEICVVARKIIHTICFLVHLKHWCLLHRG